MSAIGYNVTLIPGFPSKPQAMTGQGATTLPSPGRRVYCLLSPSFNTLDKVSWANLIQTVLK